MAIGGIKMKKKIKKLIKEKKNNNDVSNADIEVDEGDVKQRDKWNSSKKAMKKLNFFDRWRLKKNPDLSYYIVMFFPNGTCKEWVILNKNTHFRYKGRTYIIDTTEARFDVTQNQFRLFYYYEEAMPIQNEVIPYVDEGNDIFLRIKSDNVAPLIKQAYVKVLGSSNIDKLIIISLVISGFSFFIMMVMSVVIFVLARNVDKLTKAVM